MELGVERGQTRALRWMVEGEESRDIGMKPICFENEGQNGDF